ncbi:zinc ribbon domain-containing protein [Desulfovibrio aminophilus]|nr:zinc ribbon domain-containing protein [Desulfovibrio aminophilus]MCM0754569.1 zinc ribbon domain-containing protein [Desulfovibrio aminophilus]
MPIFEFRCRSCGRVFEELQLSASEAPACPGCGAADAERLLSASSSLTGRESGGLPDARGHGCCGDRPGDRGCVPGSCCGRASS